MRTKIYLVTLLIAFVTIFGLTACMNEDEPKDITKEVTMYVSSETGIMYDLFDSEGEFPIECMLVKEQGEDEYRPLAFCGIQGFEYEKGYEYDLRVNKTTLANPPACLLYTSFYYKPFSSNQIATVSVSSSSVSYTHLDVYKRQSRNRTRQAPEP